MGAAHAAWVLFDLENAGSDIRNYSGCEERLENDTKVWAQAAAAITLAASLARKGTTDSFSSTEKLVFTIMPSHRAPDGQQNDVAHSRAGEGEEQLPFAVAINQSGYGRGEGGCQQVAAGGSEELRDAAQPMRAEDGQAGRAFQQIQTQCGKAEPGREQQAEQHDGKGLQRDGHRRKAQWNGDVRAERDESSGGDGNSALPGEVTRAAGSGAPVLCSGCLNGCPGHHGFSSPELLRIVRGINCPASGPSRQRRPRRQTTARDRDGRAAPPRWPPTAARTDLQRRQQTTSACVRDRSFRGSVRIKHFPSHRQRTFAAIQAR